MNQRQHERSPVEPPETLTMTIFPFENQENVCITVDVIDRSSGGLGVVCDSVLEPGIVVIRNGQGGLIKGELAWMERRGGSTFRAGIKFVHNLTNGEGNPVKKVCQPFTLPEFQHPGYFAAILADVVERTEE